jgi:hypothetical protein
MKVYLSNYRNHWLSPYTILEKVFFWREFDYDEPIIKKLSDFLNPFCVAWQKFLDFLHPRINYVKIDHYDTWSMDHTLANIILPMLKQLKATKHGSPMVDLDDVPEHLRTTTTEDWDSQLTFDFYKEDSALEEPHFGKYNNIHDRWEWILNEMIFAFEHLVDDTWEEAFHSGEFDIKHVPCEWDENGKPKLYSTEHGPNHTYKLDHDGLRKVYDRMENGFRLFGKYYRGLWD